MFFLAGLGAKRVRPPRLTAAARRSMDVTGCMQARDPSKPCPPDFPNKRYVEGKTYCCPPTAGGSVTRPGKPQAPKPDKTILAKSAMLPVAYHAFVDIARQYAAAMPNPEQIISKDGRLLITADTANMQDPHKKFVWNGQEMSLKDAWQLQKEWKETSRALMLEIAAKMPPQLKKMAAEKGGTGMGMQWWAITNNPDESFLPGYLGAPSEGERYIEAYKMMRDWVAAGNAMKAQMDKGVSQGIDAGYAAVDSATAQKGAAFDAAASHIAGAYRGTVEGLKSLKKATSEALKKFPVKAPSKSEQVAMEAAGTPMGSWLIRKAAAKTIGDYVKSAIKNPKLPYPKEAIQTLQLDLKPFRQQWWTGRYGARSGSGFAGLGSFQDGGILPIVAAGIALYLLFKK